MTNRIISILALALAACGGESFTSSEPVGTADPGFDGGPGGATASGAGGSVGFDGGVGGAATGGASSVGVGSGGAGSETESGGSSVGSGGVTTSSSSGGAIGSGGSSSNGAGGSPLVPPPACCTNADCPATGVPFCSPWGTCYQGGDPYNCDYDNFCESYCVHCSGKSAGSCVVTSAPGAHMVKSCVCA